MKKVLSTLGLLASLGFSGASYAGSGHSCHMTYSVKGGAFLTYFKLKGTAHLTCSDGSSGKAKITIGGRPFGLRIGLGVFRLKGASAGIGTADGHEGHAVDGVYGDYLKVGQMVALGIGAGEAMTFENPNDGKRVSLAVEAVAGLGFQYGLSTFSLEPYEDEEPSCTPPPAEDDHEPSQKVHGKNRIMKHGKGKGPKQQQQSRQGQSQQDDVQEGPVEVIHDEV